MTEVQKKEECRNAVLEYLAARPSVAQRVETIHRKLSKENPEFLLTDVSGACEFLFELGYVKKCTEPLGSTVYWQASVSGQLFVERNYGLK